MKDPKRIERIHELKRLVDSLQPHVKEIADDKYGCPDVLISKAYGALAVLVQDYAPESSLY